MNYDLVLVKHPKSEQLYLFKAPAYSTLKKGDKVIVDTIRGKQEAIVEDVLVDVKEESGVYQFIRMVNQGRTIKKVLSFVYTEQKPLNYDEMTYLEAINFDPLELEFNDAKAQLNKLVNQAKEIVDKYGKGN